MQETDQNYDEFKSLLRKHIQILLNDMFPKYREQQNQVRQVGEALPSIPTLNLSHCEFLLGRHPADQENRIQEIPPIFYHCFSKKSQVMESLQCCPMHT
jgi:hypothetical protein